MLLLFRRTHPKVRAGLCGSHIGSRPLLGKIFRQGFYWPKAASDAAELVKKCEGCQKCARDQKQPSSLTQLIQPTWPLQRWGLDLLGPLPPAQGKLRYVVVAVEYFSKWIEAKPLATITSATIQKFFWQNIVCRFGVPKAITVVMDPTSQGPTFAMAITWKSFPSRVLLAEGSFGCSGISSKVRRLSEMCKR